MKLHNQILSGVAIFSFLFSSYTVNANNDQTISYQNQRGSTLTLTFHPNKNDTGTLSGSFTSAVGECKQDVGVALPLNGFYNGNAIALTVNFPHCKHIAAMTGNMLEEKSQIKMLWLVNSDVKDPQGKNWNSNYIGNDFYNKK